MGLCISHRKGEGWRQNHDSRGSVVSQRQMPQRERGTGADTRRLVISVLKLHTSLGAACTRSGSPRSLTAHNSRAVSAPDLRMKNTAVLLSSSPIALARKGVKAAITQFLVAHNGSVLHADDHIDSGRELFLSRLNGTWTPSTFPYQPSKSTSALWLRPIASNITLL